MVVLEIGVKYEEFGFDTTSSGHFRPRFDVEKALKDVRIFRRSSKKRPNFDVRRRIDVYISTVF